MVYESKPSICNYCQKYGNTKEVCRKNKTNKNGDGTRRYVKACLSENSKTKKDDG